jgi:D-threonate/D-erythronate kinase
MSRAANDLIGVIADDFTGALDTGVEFVRAGLETTLLIRPEYSQPVPVQVINTDSRDTDVTTAQQRVTQAARRLLGRRIFKKIDSTMRGHIGAEIEAVLNVTGIRKAVVCPAVIEAGRTVQDGQLRVDDVPLHESAFAGDPFWPASTSDIARLVGRPVTHVTLDTVRAGATTLATVIARVPARIVTVDACTHSDLALISRAIAANCLPCGALGLARAWARGFHSGVRAELASVVQRLGTPVLVVAGSRHPKTIAQVDRLISERTVTPIEVALGTEEQRKQEWIGSGVAALSAGRSVVIRASAEEIGQGNQRQALVELLGALTAQVCQAVALGGLVLMGGETASAICQRLGAAGVRILGEVEVGIPWGAIVEGAAAELPLVTKAGGFGPLDALIRSADQSCGYASKRATRSRWS